MSNVIAWIAAAAECPEHFQLLPGERRLPADGRRSARSVDEMQMHQFPSDAQECRRKRDQGGAFGGELTAQSHSRDMGQLQPERRAYRGRTVAMLRRYMRYSIETGRLPSLLGQEFFRTKVTSYNVVTFEDRVIFVHDMETCLAQLDEFSRELIARHILQEHDQEATARLLHCNQRTVRRLTPFALDQLGEILLEMGLMERLAWDARTSCQEAEDSQNSASDCGDCGNKFWKMSG
jgi:hypothetical protein